MGKTRLALEAAARQVGQYADGVYWVSLAPLQSAASLVPTVAQAVGLTFSEGKRAPRQQLLDYLRNKQVLLLIDNCEHLLEGLTLLSDILSYAPQVKLLATSRAGLNVRGEHRYHLFGMHTPDWDASQDALESSAVALFVQSAQRARPGLELQAGALEAAARICRLVEGMPLGILLAASWIEVLAPQEIAAEIVEGLDFLESDLRDLPERQRSMRAVFDYSWAQLGEREQAVFRATSAFVGGFTRTAAQVVASAGLRDLRQLSNRSLIYRTASGRYEMHELLRQYAVGKLAQSQDEIAVRDRHSAYYSAAVERWAEDLKGPRQVETLDRMDVEFANLRAAWEWAVERGQVAQLDRAAEGLGLYYGWRWRRKEGVEAFGAAAERLEGLAAGPSRRVLLKVLGWQGNMSSDRERVEAIAARCAALLEHPDLAGQDIRYEKALLWNVLGSALSGREPDKEMQLHERSLSLFQDLGNRWWTARAMLSLGSDAWQTSHYLEAEEWYQRGLEIARVLGDPRMIADFVWWQSFIAAYRGQDEQAERLARECIEIIRRLGDRARLAGGLLVLAAVLVGSGKYRDSESLAQESIEIREHLGLVSLSEFCILGLAQLYQGQYAQARVSMQSGLTNAQAAGADRIMGVGQLGLGMIALADQDDERATAYLSASLPHYQKIGRRDEMNGACALLGVVLHRQGKIREAQTRLNQALELSADIPGGGGFGPEVIAACALLQAEQGHPARAVELYAVVSSRPNVAHSRWFEDVFGKPIAAASARLPPEVVQAARERGSAQELADTVQALLKAFKGDVSD